MLRGPDDGVYSAEHTGHPPAANNFSEPNGDDVNVDQASNERSAFEFCKSSAHLCSCCSKVISDRVVIVIVVVLSEYIRVWTGKECCWSGLCRAAKGCRCLVIQSVRNSTSCHLFAVKRAVLSQESIPCNSAQRPCDKIPKIKHPFICPTEHIHPR